MSQLSNGNYDLGIASLEVILLVLASFIAGALLCYLLRLLGLCCRRTKPVTDEGSQARPEPGNGHIRYPTIEATSAPAVTPVVATTAGGSTSYQADINSLIRSGGSSHDEVYNARTTETPVPDQRLDHTSPVSSPPAVTSFEERARASLAGIQDTHQPTQRIDDYTQDIPQPKADQIDDLKKLEGIGPGIEKLLNEAGIYSYARLATMDRNHLKDILEAGGSEFGLHEPKSWPYQAELAAKNNWNRLKEYQDFLLADRR